LKERQRRLGSRKNKKYAKESRDRKRKCMETKVKSLENPISIKGEYELMDKYKKIIGNEIYEAMAVI